jgi:hypothetical protein
MILIQLNRSHKIILISRSQTRIINIRGSFYYCSISSGNKNKYHATYCNLNYQKISRESTSTSLKRCSSLSYCRSKRK